MSLQEKHIYESNLLAFKLACVIIFFEIASTIVYQADRDYHDDIKAALLQVDSALSMFNEKSVISRINQSDGGETNKMFLDVYKKAIEVSQETDGAFDITVAPLVNAWGFGFKNGEMPTPQQVDSIRQFGGWK